MRRLFPSFSTLVTAMLLVGYGCVEPYDPPEIKDAKDFLFIDGFLNTSYGTGNVIIKHTTPLNSDAPPLMETGALVQLKENNGNNRTFSETAPGVYNIFDVVYNPANDYKIYIKTRSGAEYETDPIALKQTPAIDSLTWGVENDEVHVFVNTHDQTKESRYYRWSCIETYKYRSKYGSAVMIDGHRVVSRPPSLQIYECWKTLPIYDILLATTTQLSNDVVSQNRLLTIPARSLKISNKYSIKVQQQSLSEEAYTYWREVEKTSENLGSLFDPLPGRVEGNIHSITNPNEPVIGFISGGNVSEARLFIDADELPLAVRNYRYPICPMDTVPEHKATLIPGDVLLIEPVYEGLSLVGYLTASVSCVDCRVYGGGVNQKPDFWIE